MLIDAPRESTGPSHEVRPMISNSRRFLSVALAVVLGLAVALPALAQSTPKKPVAATKPAPTAAKPAVPGAPAGALVGIIRGRVLDHGAGLQYANVVVLGTKQGTATDEGGNFVIAGVPVGTQQVQVQAIGFDKLVETAQVNAGQTATLTFNVGASKTVKTIEEIEVKAERRIDT